MTRRSQRRAVVIGAGIAGLLAARVLTERFDEVCVVEKDLLPPGPAHRPGVPQSHHPHALLQRGARIMEDLFPGLRDELLRHGAPSFSHGGTFLMWFPTGFAPQVDTGLQLQTFSRALLESRLRDRVAALPQVEFRTATTVTGLVLADDGSRVTAVPVRSADGHEYRIEAELTVVAAGRTSKLPRWLAELGRRPAREIVVDSRIAYASRIYDGLPREWNGLAEMATAPRTRGGAITRIEDGRAIVALHGVLGNHPPRDDAGYLAFARSLANPYLGDVLAEARPLTEVRSFTRMANRRLELHQIPDWPSGLLAMGDAVCSFNPVYAQGMTVAALQALELRRVLATPDPAGAASAFQRRVRRTLTLPWLMSTAEDSIWAHLAGGRATIANRAAHHYLRAVLDEIPADPRLYAQFLRALHMLAAPTALLRARPALHALLRQTGTEAPAPQARTR